MSACVKSCPESGVIIASLAIIIISITCASMVGKKCRQIQIMAQSHSTKKSFDWCLPCELLTNRSTPHLVEKLNKTLVGGLQHCCACTKEQATVLLELMSSTAVKEVPKTTDADNFALSRASAHQHFTVSGYYGITEFPFPDNNVNLEFDVAEQDPLIDHARHITVTQSAMVVQLPGRYYIYSSIFFKPDSFQPCKNLPKQVLYRMVDLITDIRRDCRCRFPVISFAICIFISMTGVANYDMRGTRTDFHWQLRELKYNL